MNSANTLSPFFEPTGIAIVGARSTAGFGYTIPSNLKKQGWGDRTFLVNPNGGELHGMPVYKRLADVPHSIDLALVIVPAPAVPGILDDIGRLNIKHVIVMSAGFAEAGKSGKNLQAETKKIAETYGLNVIGPNCVGVVNTANRFSTAEIMPEVYTPGKLAVIAQSGVFGHNILERINEYGIFISKAVTLGNRLTINEIDMLNYFHQDPDTDMIVMYIEGSENGRLLGQTLKKITPDKPVIVLKSGRTTEGRAATESHTGSLSGEDVLYDGMFAQTGAIRAKTLDELTALTRVFATQPLPKGKNLGIITGSGSMGALATDSAINNGLSVQPLSNETIKKVKEGAPDWMNVKNPLDVGPSGLFPKGFSAMMEDPEIHMVLAIITIPYVVYQPRQASTTIDAAFFASSTPLRERTWPKPFLIAVVSHKQLVGIFKTSTEPNIPVFTSPEKATRSLASLWRYHHWKKEHE